MHMDYDVNGGFGVVQFSGICKYTWKEISSL